MADPRVSSGPVCRLLRAADAEALTRFFESIAADPGAGGFHPHPFDAETACSIAGHAGRDCFVGMFADDRLIAYGMLRGWDEGYEVPSLGIYVAPQARRTGAATRLMLELHDLARARGAGRIRLKVYPDNEAAVRLYVQLGYQFTHLEKDQRVGHVELSGPG